MNKREIATAAVGFLGRKGMSDYVAGSVLTRATEAAAKRDEIADTVLEKCCQGRYEAGRTLGDR